MNQDDRSSRNPFRRFSRSVPAAITIMVICIAVIIATAELAVVFPFIARHRETLIDVELTVFAVAAVELVGWATVNRFRRRGAEAVGHSLRAVIRGVVYIALTIGIVSSLSANPALAISLGTVTGLIVAFATQNIIGNVIAGVMLAIIRPVRVGDQVTLQGQTGTIKEIDLIYTILETDAQWIYVPSTVMFTTIVLKKKGSSVPGRHPD